MAGENENINPLFQSQKRLENTASRATRLRQNLVSIKQIIAQSFDRVSKTQELLDELKETIQKSKRP